MNENGLSYFNRRVTINGHFGEFMQGRLEIKGPVVLITLPSLVHKVQVTFTSGNFDVSQKGSRYYTQSVISNLLNHLKLQANGKFDISLFMPEACGTGSSTATRVAILRAVRPRMSTKTLVETCLLDEGASDPVMYSSPERLLWAPRLGKVLKQLPVLPKISCIGGFYGSPMKTNPNDKDFPIIKDLVDLWSLPRKTDKFLAELCSESSSRTIFHRNLQDDPTKVIAKKIKALGFSIAHTGSVRNFIFPYNQIPEGTKNILIDSGFRGIETFSLGKSK